MIRRAGGTIGGNGVQIVAGIAHLIAGHAGARGHTFQSLSKTILIHRVTTETIRFTHCYGGVLLLARLTTGRSPPLTPCGKRLRKFNC